MFPALRNKLIELNLMVNNTRTIDSFAWQNSHGSRFDVRKFINQQPYWLSTKMIEEEDKYKKIILNIPILANLETIKILCSFLLNYNFQLYVWQVTGEFKEIKSHGDLSNCLDQVRYESASNMEDYISAAGKEVSDYYLLDWHKLDQLFGELAQLLEFNTEKKDNLDRLHLEQQFLSQSMLQQIVQLNADNPFKEIAFTYHFETDTKLYPGSYQFIWTNTFSADEFVEFITSLIESKDNELLFLKKDYCEKLVELIVDDKDADVLDVSRFKKLTTLVIHGQVKKILGLENLLGLKVLKLGGSDVSQLNLRAYKNLANTTVFAHTKGDMVRFISEQNAETNNTKLILQYKEFDELIHKGVENLDFSKVTELELTLDEDEYSSDYRNCSLDLSLFPNLRKLHVLGEGNLSSIKGLEQCVQLEDLKILHTYVSINTATLTNLRKAYFNFFDNAQVIGLTACVKLEDLFIDSNIHDQSVFDGFYFPNLLHLKISGQHQYGVVRLEKCKALVTLFLANLGVDGPLNFANMTHLQELTLHNLSNIDSITGIDKCAQLRICDIPGRLINDPVQRKIVDSIPSRKYVDYSWGRHLKYHKGREHHAIFTKYMRLDSESLFAPQEKTHETDGSTYTHPSKEHIVEKLFTPIGHDVQIPSPIHYRLVILDVIELGEDGTVLLGTTPLTDLKPYQIDHSNHSAQTLYNAVAQLPLSSNFSITLPGLSANDRLVAISDEDKLDILHTKKRGQYRISMKAETPTAPLFVQYQIAKDEAYEYKKGMSDTILRKVKNLKPLPKKLHKALTECLNDPKHAKQFARIVQAKKAKQRLHAIMDYCKIDFQNLSLDLQQGQSAAKCTIPVLMEIIKQQKGSCRHRALAFMVLCRYFKLPVRIARSKCHAFAEARFTSEGRRCWKFIDVGGSPAKLTIKDNPAEQLQAMSQESTYTSKKQKASANKKIPIETGESKVTSLVACKLTFTEQLAALDLLEKKPVEHDLKPLFVGDNQWLERCQTLAELAQGLINMPKAALLRIASAEKAWDWHRALYAYYQSQSIDAIYVDSVEEFKSLFETTVIQDGNEQACDGPLKKLIARGNGVIIVNWSNFNANQRAIYKSIMDRPPSLHGHQFAKNLQVIGLLPDRTEVNDVFLSRCDELKLPVHFHLQGVEASLPKNDWLYINKQPPDFIHPALSLNLYQSAEWYKFLVDQLHIQDHNFVSVPGPLVQAMQLGVPIAIKNAPFTDPYFLRFWQGLITEGCVFSNGEKITMAAGFQLYLSNQPASLIVPVAFIKDEKKSTGKTYLFNQESFYQLFDTQHIDKDGRIDLKEQGWLEESSENDQFVLQGDLTTHQWQRLYDRLHLISKNNARAFHFYIESNHDKAPSQTKVCTTVSDLVKQLQQAETGNSHIESTDPHFIIQLIQQHLSVPGTNVFYLSEQDSWSTLIESISLARVDKKIKANRCELSFWEKLKKGETVILSGQLSKSEYLALQTLFLDKPYLYVNGERHYPLGKLIWVGEKQLALQALPILGFEVRPNHDDYLKQLAVDFPHGEERQRTTIRRFISKLESVENVQQARYPVMADFTYAKYQAIYTYAFNAESEEDNPLKAILTYHYQKNTELYAFINVLAKLVFGGKQQAIVRLDKLMPLLATIHSESEFDQCLYRLLNCFSAKAFQKIIHLSAIKEHNKLAGIPQLKAKAKQRFIVLLSKYDHHFKTMDWVQQQIAGAVLTLPVRSVFQNQQRYEKQNAKLVSALRDPNKSLICLLGETGTGKTYSVRDIKKAFPNAQIRSGADNAQKCLEDNQSDGLTIWLLDEYNLQISGKWELLRGLKQNPPVLVIEGKPYPVSPQKLKIILTANPVHYPGRHFHQVAWDMAHVIWFAPFQLSFLQQKIRNYFDNLPKNDRTLLIDEEIIQLSEPINTVYAFFRDNAKYLGDMTLRDIENVCIRCHLLKGQYPATTWLQCIRQALFDELEGVCNHPEKLAQLQQMLFGKEDFNAFFPAPNVPCHPELVIPPEKERIWRLILNDLSLRQLRIQRGTNFLGKLGTLLQGASGVGKSMLMIKMLEHLGFKRDAADTTLRFYQVTVGSSNVEEILIKAFHEGSVVILDELNLDPKLKTLLNQLLTGYDLQDNQAKTAGFTVLSTQNPPKYQGCFQSSRELDNRFHKINMGDYSLPSLEFIAQALKSPVAKELTQTYERLRVHPDRYNSRNFFSAMNKTLSPGAVNPLVNRATASAEGQNLKDVIPSDSGGSPQYGTLLGKSRMTC